jgi:hypothetical protein
MGQEILKDVGEVEFTLIDWKSLKQRFLKEFHDRFIREKVTDQEAGKEDHQASDESGLQFVEMLPETHDG